MIRCQKNLSSSEQEILIDKAELDYLNHRASLTGHVLDINKSMSKVNETVIGLLSTISATNAKVYEFNVVQHSENINVSEKGISKKGINLLAKKNAKTTTRLTERAEKNSEYLEDIFERTETNSGSLTEMIGKLKGELSEIDSQWESIESMQQLCVEMLAASLT